GRGGALALKAQGACILPFLRSLKNVIGSPLVVKSELAFLDQAVLSATNFLLSIILIKSVPKSEYGYYSIATAILLFLVSIQNAVVTTPLLVLLITKKGDDKQRYVTALYFGQLMVLLPAVGVGVALTGTLYFLGVDAVQ